MCAHGTLPNSHLADFEIPRLVDESETMQMHNMNGRAPSENCANNNADKIRDQVKGMSSIDGTFSSMKMWKIKKKVAPRPKEPQAAKKDSLGNLITAPKQLRKLYLDAYIYRLRHRVINAEYDKLKKLKHIQ